LAAKTRGSGCGLCRPDQHNTLFDYLVDEMNAVTTIEPQGQVANVAQAESSILAVIARAAADPSCDLDKMERLLNMQERVMAKQAEVEFNSAMAAMQSEIPSVAERGKSHSGAYATLEDIVDVARPIMKKYGFAVSFRINQGDKITIVGVLMHKGGHREETSLTLAADTSGSKNAVQAIGSSVSYGKRYVLSALLNIATRSEDDNGYAAVPVTPLTDVQAKQLTGLLGRLSDEDQAKVFDIWGDVAQVGAAKFDKCHGQLMKMIGAAKAANHANP